MRVYTRTGDKGRTSLGGGRRVVKSDGRIEVLGNLDELNACLGLALVWVKSKEAKRRLPEVQNILFNLGAQLVDISRGGFEIVSSNKVIEIEKEIDELSEKLLPLKNFILPGGSKASACLHLARAVCRRAERNLVGSLKPFKVKNPHVLSYLNRLSSYLFVLARWENKKADGTDVPWKKFFS